jgi:hypothetical protein
MNLHPNRRKNPLKVHPARQPAAKSLQCAPFVAALAVTNTRCANLAAFLKPSCLLVSIQKDTAQGTKLLCRNRVFSTVSLVGVAFFIFDPLCGSKRFSIERD